ncbi:hypothetical protein COCON_G00014950 [Conger conger]|uniref:DNA mismatch repair protein Mlh3 n=1 Tax=Conger conger TaxID=82655 RepID=A0A9Q1E374_CONCO|nr:hypothetical protein COCON_G00014950 [Conger conger]
MGREDMERVGKRYFTSKCSSLEDLESLRFYGFRGEAVASIASLATLVEISSRSRLSGKTFVKIFKDGKGMDVFESESCRPSTGTTVVICNFFHNMPVRRKRVDAVLECERIRQRVEAISLMHPSISFTLKNDSTAAMVVQLPKVKSTYYRFVQIHGMARAQKLAEISLSHSQFEMSGYIGCEGHYNNSLQFLFVNSRLVLKTRIHKLLNFLLKKTNASGRQNGNQDVCSDEVVNPIDNDEPPCIDTTQGENKQSESVAVGSNDWLEHFDDSIGKVVYINKVTGLSKFEAPAAEETHVPCTTDVTTMSISVISRKGFEYTCYPFQSELVLPFLPRSRAERVLSSGLDHADGSEAANSLTSLFSEWSNPVFARPPEVAVDVTCGQAEGLAVKIHNILYPYRFTKDMIHSMKVVHQVDKKFLACLINTTDTDAESGNLLVLVDQHAAHERVRLENLITESYEEDPEAPGQKRLCSSSVTPPLEIVVTEEELRLLRSCQPFLRGLGLEIRFAETGDPHLLVGKVPMCFVEREASELRRGRHTATKAIVEEYIREQIELLRSAGRVRGTLPLTVLKVLASQACHGAIKFNHSLSVEECCSLVGSLSTCQLPFQCAHGRPSMVPLADLLHLDNHQQESSKPNLRKLRQMYRAWELCGQK